MKERQTETLGSGRSRWRKVLFWYLSVGAVLTISRVAALVFLVYRSTGANAIDHFLTFGLLYPETVLTKFATPSILQLEELAFVFVWGSIIALVSFAMVTPILLVGWLAQRRSSR
jgi:hypothetical protein